MCAKEDLISVVVPIYKVEKYLDRCIESIVNQTYQNLEIILVDDGSPDMCPQICDQWAEKDLRIRVIHKENGGLSDARNAGMKIAKGKYIAFVDSDDWVDLGMYSTLLDAIKKADSDIACCKLKKVWDTNFESNREQKIREHEVFNKEEGLYELIADGKIQQVVWNKIYKKDVISDILFEKGKHHEDEYWTYQVLGRSNRTVVVDYEGYYYFQRGDSIMGNGYVSSRLNVVEAKAQRQVYLKKNFPSLEFIGNRNFLYTCLYHGQQVLIHFEGNEKQDALTLLKKNYCRFKLDKKEKRKLCLKDRIWLCLGEHCFVLTCKMRNVLKVGF